MSVPAANIRIAIGSALVAMAVISHAVLLQGRHTDHTLTAPITLADASTTGPEERLTLVPMVGDLVIAEPGAEIIGRDVSGTIRIEAEDVEIRNSRIRGTGDFGILVASGSARITNTEISGFENGIGGDNWTASRVDIFGTTSDGVKIGSYTALEDSWIHDLRPVRGAHADGVQMQSGVRNATVVRNNIDVSTSDSNAAIFLAPDLGPSSSGPVLVEGNFLDGGNYSLYCVDGADGKYAVGNITIRNNYFGSHFTYGPVRVNVPVNWTGNVRVGDANPVLLS